MNAVSDEEKTKEEILVAEPTLKEQIFAMVNNLPAEQLKEVLTFVEFLNYKVTKPQQLIDPGGMWAGMGIDISEEDMAEARQEMWGNFPREDKQIWGDYLTEAQEQKE